MSNPLPRLRSDLIVSRQDLAGETCFVVKDPATEKYFRFRAAEQFILEQLDGATSLQTIRERVEEHFGSSLDPETLTGFLERLSELGLLDTGRKPSLERPGRPKGKLLYLRFKVFDPDALLDALIGKVRFFFTPYFVSFAGTLIALAAIITLTGWGDITGDFGRLHPLHAVLLAVVTIFFVGTAHEFAHGLTCKHFGGRVHDMGFMLIYFQPAMYCNVSDAWLFPEKSKRLWVTFAGSFFEMFLWAVSTITWRLTDSGTWPNQVALVIMATSGIKTLFNYNPLIKLDGYYLLSDLVEMPNLRKRSFSFIASKLWRVPEAADDPPTPRERRIFLTYGTIAATASTLWLFWVAWKYGHRLIGRYQLIGLLLFIAIMVVRSRSRIRRLMPKQQPPSTFLPPEKVRPTLTRRGKALLFGGATTLVLFAGCMELKIGGDVTVLPLHNADVRAQVDGLISDVYVSEGDVVRKGALICRLSDRDYRSELEKTQAMLNEGQSRLEMLEAGPRKEEIEVAEKEVVNTRATAEHARKSYLQAIRIHDGLLVKAKSNVDRTQQRLGYAQRDVERIKSLRDSSVVSRKEYEDVEEQMVVREKDLQSARADLDMVQADQLEGLQKELANAERESATAAGRLQLLRAGSRKEQVDATRAEVERLETEKRFLEEQLALIDVPSPIDGIVATPQRLVAELKGQFVHKGELIAKVFEMRTITAEIAIPEKEIADVTVGQDVALKVRAYPQRIFRGKVTAIATTASGGGPLSAAPAAPEREPGARTILVTTQLENHSLLLKPEMTGKAKVLCGKRRLFDLLSRRISRTVKVEFWSWW
jgi:multidrug resistance efflux pump